MAQFSTLLWISFFSVLLFFVLYFSRVSIDKFLEKISPFPYLRENGHYGGTIEDITYEGMVIKFFFISILCSILVFFFSDINIFTNIGLSISFLLPGCMLLLRIHTFSDDNILSETGMGYNPTHCWILSFLAGAFCLVIGFSGLNFSNIPLYIPIITIAFTLLCFMIPIFPDYINKLLSYDIRSEKGYLTLRIITAVAIFIQGIVFAFFSLFVL